MYTTEQLKEAITILKPTQLILWLIAADKGYDNVSQLTINDVREYGITESAFYRNKNTVSLPCKLSTTNNNIDDDDLDAIEAAAAQAYHDELPSPLLEIKLPQTWHEKFKSIDLRSDRLKKASRGYTVPEEEEEEPVSSRPSRKFVPIDIGAIEDDNYSTHDDEAELAAMEEEQKRRDRMLEMGIVT